MPLRGIRLGAAIVVIAASVLISPARVQAEVPSVPYLLPAPTIPQLPSSPLNTSGAEDYNGSSPGYPTVQQPYWWNGQCDGWTGFASWNGLEACGASDGTGNSCEEPKAPSNCGDYGTEGGPISGVHYWECVELSTRWLYQAFGLGLVNADGYDLVDNYNSKYLVSNPGKYPLRYVKPGTAATGDLGPGDVVQLGATSPGHTLVVYAVSPAPFTGTGSIDVIQENHAGTVTLSAKDWMFSENDLNGKAMSATAWLHYTNEGVGSGPSPAVAYTSSGQQILFWQGTDQHLWEAWYDGGWHGPVDWTSNWTGNLSWPSAANLADAPTVTEASGQQVVFWTGVNGHLWEAWYSSNGWNGPVDWTANWSGTASWPSSANPITAPAVGVTGTEQLLFWDGANGHIWEAWWQGNWNGPVDLASAWGTSGSVASAPAITVQNGHEDLFWAGGGGHLYEAWYSSGWNGPVDWTANWSGTNAWAPSNGLTSAPTVTWTTDGSQEVVFWNASGHLNEAWYANGWNGPVDWTAQWNSGYLSTNSAVTALPGEQVVFWGGVNQHLWEAWYANGWNGPVDWTQAWEG